MCEININIYIFLFINFTALKLLSEDAASICLYLCMYVCRYTRTYIHVANVTLQLLRVQEFDFHLGS